MTRMRWRRKTHTISGDLVLLGIYLDYFHSWVLEFKYLKLPESTYSEPSDRGPILYLCKRYTFLHMCLLTDWFRVWYRLLRPKGNYSSQKRRVPYLYFILEIDTHTGRPYFWHKRWWKVSIDTGMSIRFSLRFTCTP